jgi:hypothetical protein
LLSVFFPVFVQLSQCLFFGISKFSIFSLFSLF